MIETAGSTAAVESRERFDFELSRWSQSGTKRIVDVAAVLLALPVLLPLLAVVALMVFVTSRGPILFRQRRIGLHGVSFEIYKFRTMRPPRIAGTSALAVESASRITWLGSFLRRSKIDELPQVWNVLIGDMSLVGPRPKVPEQQPEPLPCRPGLTGAATLAFAREEVLLTHIPSERLADYFGETVLPLKQRLDAQYMRRATMSSDLRLLVDTVLGRWKRYTAEVPEQRKSKSHFRKPRLEESTTDSRCGECEQSVQV